MANLGNVVPDAQGDRVTGVRAGQRVAWVPKVPAARIAEGAGGMETDMSHPQFAQAVPLREKIADVLKESRGKSHAWAAKKGLAGVGRQQMRSRRFPASDFWR